VARAAARPWRSVAAGDTLHFDGVRVRVLAPDATWRAARATGDDLATGRDPGDPNEASVVLQLEFGARRFLLAGDAEAGEERWLLARYGDGLRSDVLKVGHHGSATSSTPDFLDAVRPEVAVISVGAGNRYGHPSHDVLRSLDERGVHLLRTDDDGTIVVSTDGRDLEVRAGGRGWRSDPAASRRRRRVVRTGGPGMRAWGAEIVRTVSLVGLLTERRCSTGC
ncbi:MAG TPA: MBL fold metallo-hydrolase, partial [Gemmatimonadaceae bacterium]|nr:MBL fold metallo-hydrolase [Gemmatimonadaceae bacterium]